MTAVVVLSFPVVAAVGGNLILGKANAADAVTSLSGAASTNLRITNTRADAPALDLRVVSGAPPLKVNSRVRVANLNADRLDGKHAAAFALVAHGHAGVYLPAGGTAADAALLDGRDSSAFAPAWPDCPPGTTVVGYGRSGPACSAGTGQVTLDAGGDVGPWPSLVLDPAGNPVVAYYDRTNGDLKLVHCNDPNCTEGDESIQTIDAAGDVGLYPSLMLDAGGHPVISYQDWGNRDLKLAHCNDPNCAGGDDSIQVVDAYGYKGAYTSLTLDTAGYPVISYMDETDGDLMLAHCNDPNCAGADEPIEIVDSNGETGLTSSLALDAAGHPVISYYFGGQGDLMLAHCNDANCTGGNESIQSVDTTGDVGGWTSLLLDLGGNPVVSYYDYTNLNLKLVHCNDPYCAAGNESIQAVDVAGFVGQTTSLQFDTAGFPVISYWDETSVTLKVAHCNDPFCAGGDEALRVVDGDYGTGQCTSMVLDAAGRALVAYYDALNLDLKLAVWRG